MWANVFAEGKSLRRVSQNGLMSESPGRPSRFPNTAGESTQSHSSNADVQPRDSKFSAKGDNHEEKSCAAEKHSQPKAETDLEVWLEGNVSASGMQNSPETLKDPRSHRGSSEEAQALIVTFDESPSREESRIFEQGNQLGSEPDIADAEIPEVSQQASKPNIATAEITGAIKQTSEPEHGNAEIPDATNQTSEPEHADAKVLTGIQQTSEPEKANAEVTEEQTSEEEEATPPRSSEGGPRAEAEMERQPPQKEDSPIAVKADEEPAPQGFSTESDKAQGVSEDSQGKGAEMVAKTEEERSDEDKGDRPHTPTHPAAPPQSLALPSSGEVSPQPERDEELNQENPSNLAGQKKVDTTPESDREAAAESAKEKEAQNGPSTTAPHSQGSGQGMPVFPRSISCPDSKVQANRTHLYLCL